MSVPSVVAVQQLLATHRPRSSSEGYPAHVRETVVGAARAWLAAGWSPNRVGRELGLAATTIRLWIEASEKPAFRPVTLSSSTMNRALCLVTPSGYRLEGLDLESAASLLERLG
jgi:hypothetical protein